MQPSSIAAHRQYMASLYQEQIRNLQQSLNDQARVKQQMEMAQSPSVVKQKEVWEANQRRLLEDCETKQQHDSQAINKVQLLLAAVRKPFPPGGEEEYLNVLRAMFERFYDRSVEQNLGLSGKGGFGLNRPDAAFPTPIENWFSHAASVIVKSEKDLRPSTEEQVALNVFGLRLSIMKWPF